MLMIPLHRIGNPNNYGGSNPYENLTDSNTDKLKVNILFGADLVQCRPI